MSGFIGFASKYDVLQKIFLGADYHSHLGTKFGGMAIIRGDNLYYKIHDIRSVPFKAQFEDIVKKLRPKRGTPKIYAGLGVISDGEPQPLAYRSKWGKFAIATNGKVNNLDDLVEQLSKKRRLTVIENPEPTEFNNKKNGPNQTDIVANLIAEKNTIPEGIAYMRSKIKGALSLTILLHNDDETGIWAAADTYGNNNLWIGKGIGGFAAATSTTAFPNLGFGPLHLLAPGEITYLSASSLDNKLGFPGVDVKEPCIFLDIYTEFPSGVGSLGMSAEAFRYQTGACLAKRDHIVADLNFGVADSGIGHMLGYTNEKIAQMHNIMQKLLKVYNSGKLNTMEFESALHDIFNAALEVNPIKRALVKYSATWGRSYQPDMQEIRDFVGFMKQIPIPELIDGYVIKFFEDSIVRGTQLKQMIEKLRKYSPKALHARVGSAILLDACPYNRSTKQRRELEAWGGIAYLEGIPISPDGHPSEEVELVDAKFIQEYADPSTKRYKNLVEWICADLNLDSLMYLYPHELLLITGRKPNEICRHCFGYPSQRL